MVAQLIKPRSAPRPPGTNFRMIQSIEVVVMLYNYPSCMMHLCHQGGTFRYCREFIACSYSHGKSVGFCGVTFKKFSEHIDYESLLSQGCLTVPLVAIWGKDHQRRSDEFYSYRKFNGKLVDDLQRSISGGETPSSLDTFHMGPFSPHKCYHSTQLVGVQCLPAVGPALTSGRPREDFVTLSCLV